jgi:hypothetical protein
MDELIQRADSAMDIALMIAGVGMGAIVLFALYRRLWLHAAGVALTAVLLIVGFVYLRSHLEYVLPAAIVALVWSFTAPDLEKALRRWVERRNNQPHT